MTPALFYLIIAIGLIGTELLIMQLSVFWFLFVGVGALIASLVAWAMPELSWAVVTAIFLLASVVVSIGLYPMLKRWQDKPSALAGHDAIGQTAKVTEAISVAKPGKVVWSGSEWAAQTVEGEADFHIGDDAVIKDLRGIRLIVGR